MNNTKKILFLTTHNLATNPRLVKEIELALKNGYKVELVCFEFYNWSYSLNQELKERFKTIKIYCISASRKPFLAWFVNTAAETANRWAGKSLNLPVALLSQAVSRRSNMLVGALKNIKDVDLVIGHNPGALYPTFAASQKFNCAAGFDVEDYHPGEGRNQYLQGLTKSLMDRLLTEMSYVSFAAPLILKEVQNNIAVVHKNWMTVLNYFPACEFIEPYSLPHDAPVKMVWFSQNIDSGRGLEFFIPALKKLGNQLELHLYGNLNEDFFNLVLKGVSNIIIHNVVCQKRLHKELARYDIGLALEAPSADANRNICLTNKILAYFQSGLFILATPTAAQLKFLTEKDSAGLLIDNTYDPINVLQICIDTKNEIRSLKQARYKNAASSNWEFESEPLRSVWASKIQNKQL